MGKFETKNGFFSVGQAAGWESLNSVLPEQVIVYESVEMQRYQGGDGHPYLHDIKTNGTTKKIVGYQQGMLAFDQYGNPLKIDWWSLDTDSDSAYFYLDKTGREIAPNETYDEKGGWSLNFFGDDPFVDKIAYVLYCDKEITFEDGTVWKNPDFDSWRSTYEGKKTEVAVLESYYPYEQKINLGGKIEVDHSQEYSQWEIHFQNDSYYYKDKKIKIFMDLRPDSSFENFAFNEQGTLNLVLRRNGDGIIEKLDMLSLDETNKIMHDLRISVPTGDEEKNLVAEDINRLILEDTSALIQDGLRECSDNKWYVFENNGHQYIYYKNLAQNYAYQYEQDKHTLNIMDIGKFSNAYVLLSIPQNSDLIINYNSKTVSYLKLTI